MEMGLQKSVSPRQASVDLDRLMERYQQADPEAPHVLVVALSPALLRFFRSQVASRQQADDLLQETWMRIHRARHTYRPGEPVLPWVYAIARRVQIDGCGSMATAGHGVSQCTRPRWRYCRRGQ